MSRGSEIVLVDSSFFFALFTRTDSWHQCAVENLDIFEEFPIIIPWPILYETMNTRFVRNLENVRRFERVVRRHDATLLDDSKYRSVAYAETLEGAGRLGPYGGKSLVDSVLHAILADPNIRLTAMLTFNHRDFAHICAARDVEII